MFDLQEVLMCKSGKAMQDRVHELFVYIKGKIYPDLKLIIILSLFIIHC